LNVADEERKLSLNELEEIRREAYDNTCLSKEISEVKRELRFFYDRHINKKEFSLVQKVLLYDSRLHLFLRKLRCMWTDPYIVVEVFPHGAIKIKDPTKDHVFKVNGHGLKHFLEMLGEGNME